MSDDEEQMYQDDEGGEIAQEMEEDDHGEENVPRPSKKHSRKAQNEEEGDEQDDDDEEDDEEEDEDDEEEEEEENHGRKAKKRAKHRHKRLGASRFLDIEAEVSDEDEEEEEEEEYGQDAFITNADDIDDDLTRRNHALLDSARHFEEEDNRSPEEIAKAVARRHRDRAAPYTGDMNEIPQRLLMPSVHDASLWQVRVKPGRERDIVFSLMRKAIDVEYTARPLAIMSAFQRDSLPGMIYVEARSAKHVQESINGLVGVYPSRGIQLVPIEEMASLLQIKRQETTLTPGTWVRIRRGKYQGDLAQVMDLTENGEDVGLRLVPRIDMNPRDDASLDPNSKKRKKVGAAAGTVRPSQRLFNYEEILKVYGRKNVTKRGTAYVFQNETYKEGFLEKDFKSSALMSDDVNPTLDEITQFTRRQDGGDDNIVNLSVIAEASRKAAIAVLQPGDHIEVFEGEQSGVHGIVDEIAGDVVTITAKGLDLDGQKMEMPARSVRKRFKPGDHVKVMAGQNADETGLVVSVSDNVVTFVSDMSMQEISVFSKDLREAAEVGSGTNIVGNYELYDLVQLDAQTVGVIFKTERDSFRVLDQNGQVRLVQPHQISMRRDSAKAVATDSEGHEIRINDNMKEVDGEGRKGRVLHTHQSFFGFLHNRDIVENNGVFVTRTRSLTSLAPKSGIVKITADLSKMNPSMVAPTGGMVGSGNMGRGPRDQHIGTTVTVVKGPHKGYVGTIKDTNGSLARVELRTGNKVITIDKEKLYRRLPDGRLEELDRKMAPSGQRNSNPYQGGTGFAGQISYSGPPQGAASGGRTPFNSGRTPNPYAPNSQTPAWNASSRTPAWNAGSRTPAWNASSGSPNPYAANAEGSRTPAWNVSSRSSNPYATGANAGATTGTGWGGATPGRPANTNTGWQTPGRSSGASGSSSWQASAGWASPGRPASWDTSPARPTTTSWDSQQWSAPTPAAAAATPAAHLAPTPGYSAPTPAANGRTPAAWGSGDIATPGGMIGSYVPERETEELDENWLTDSAFQYHLARIRVVVQGTKTDRYLDGAFEGLQAHVVAGASVPDGYEATVLLRFETGEERSMLAKYVQPVQPQKTGDEVLVLGGVHKGQALVVREQPDDNVVVSSKSNPTDVSGVPIAFTTTLWPDSSAA